MTRAQPAFQRIGITGKPGDPAVAETIRGLLDRLHGRGVAIFMDAESAVDTEHELLPRERLGEVCDLVIAIGGDGTLINTARCLAGRDDVSLLGINRGRIGFLVDLNPQQLEEIDRVLDGEYVSENRMLLEAEVRRHADDTLISTGVAVNDVVVHRWETARMVELSTTIDGELLNTHRSDGLIVATPTGSTAYAMASGGPITHPRLNAMVLVPICPHTLSNRPVVVDGRSELEISAVSHSASQVRISCDSQQDLGVVEGSRLLIRALPQPLRLVHPPSYGYFEVLRRKLGWGANPENGSGTS